MSRAFAHKKQVLLRELLRRGDPVNVYMQLRDGRRLEGWAVEDLGSSFTFCADSDWEIIDFADLDGYSINHAKGDYSGDIQG